MEIESRFFYDSEDYDDLLSKFKAVEGLEFEGCYLEETVQYDTPDKANSFYSKEIDGRFRLRVSENLESGKKKAKISWKRRTKETYKDGIHKEEEVEVLLNNGDISRMRFLLENVIKMEKVESYERYRNVFNANDVEIVIDKFPFAVAVEIESKAEDEDRANDIIKEWAKKLGLDLDKAYSLSWDDKYKELCEERGIKPEKFVKFL